ncbi:MAG: iron ABC transporter permease [Gammaproteobacteria bacterium]|nr:iron ABC transporter permease [Gammaproteobacteria bacterium]MBU2066918.1 iron ABC transporter permease [Gammaproteobacteria bacterium]MBU2137733.1 iron ABC transporter permease [Gammaproteobacteria bacterium]MBU2256476.1 iron ABC transporter permease [Gammaproteobacteria bacterium]MBU2293860.1 iron ABC transporter permease [Gammaproteobacteria bacterium]
MHSNHPSGLWHLRLGPLNLLLHRRTWLLSLLVLGVLLALVVMAISLGSGRMGVTDVLATLGGQGSKLNDIMVFKIRMPRIAAVVVAGLAMGMAGCLIQTLVRNRLATPDMIGVNEGASLAVIGFALYLTVGSWPWWASPLGAALAAVALFVLCRRPGEQGYLFIVIGIALSELLGAVGDFMMATQPLVHLGSIYLWTMGHFAGASYSTVAPIALILLALCPLLAWLNRPLALLRFGEATAQNLGIKVAALQLAVLGVAILVAALGTAIGGPVVFIAMTAPIIASWLSRDHLAPIWLAALWGAVLLVGSDILVRLLAEPEEIPTGTMTRLFGGVLLLILLLKDRKGSD